MSTAPYTMSYLQVWQQLYWALRWAARQRRPERQIISHPALVVCQRLRLFAWVCTTWKYAPSNSAGPMEMRGRKTEPNGLGC